MIVGSNEDQVTFTVHSRLLTQKSASFDRALNGDWKESQSKCVSVPADKPGTFKEFLKWLYGQPLFTGDDEPQSHYSVVELWILGDKIQSPGLQNAAIDAFVAHSHAKRKYPAPIIIRHLYNNSLSGSGMRRLIVDRLAWGQSAAQFEAEAVSYYPGFLRDLVLVMKKRKENAYHGDRPPSMGQLSTYYTSIDPTPALGPEMEQSQDTTTTQT